MTKYKKRVPAILVEVIGKKEIYRSCSSELEAKAIDDAVIQAVATMKSNLPDDAKKMIVLELMIAHNIIQAPTVTQMEQRLDAYQGAVVVYLQSVTQCVPLEYESKVYVLQKLLPSILKFILKETNPKLTAITPSVLHRVGKIISLMPNRNISKYRSMNIDELVVAVATEKIVIDKSELISTSTTNKHIKRIKSFALYGTKTGLYNVSLTLTTVKVVGSRGQRDERDNLKADEIEKLLHNSDGYVNLLIRISYLTGMRLSELSKCNIGVVDGVLCFDLKNIKSKLKTQSSYRVVPVHSSLLPFMDDFKELIQQGADMKHLARRVKKVIDAVLVDTEKKSLYSLRHSFATELIHRGADSGVVSELLGHSHTSMTLQRYAKGFSIDRLKEVIELL